MPPRRRRGRDARPTASVHLYDGSDKPASIQRRSLETYALAWWAQKYHLNKNTYVPVLIPLGDFNLPKSVPSDPIYEAADLQGPEVAATLVPDRAFKAALARGS